MKDVDIRRRLFIGSTVGALALRASRTARADTPFTKFSFPATGAPTARTMPDRLSDSINVKDWGAKGNNTDDDSAAIQAAINYCLSTTSGKPAGGTVYFPPGTYKCNTSITVGSNNDVGVILRGASRESTSVRAYISKGSGSIDNIERVENMAVSGGLKLTRPCASAFAILGSIDASECINASIVCCHYYGVPRAANNLLGYLGNSGPMIAFAMGHGGIAWACRAQAGDIGYAVSGEATAILGCSCEVHNVAVRLGWGMRSVTGTSSNGAGKIRLALTSNADLIDGGSYYIQGVTGVSNNSLQVISLSGIIDGVSVDLPNCNYTSPSSGGRIIGEIPAYGASIISLQTERCNSRVELYNAHGCYVANNYHVGNDGTTEHGPITNATYNAGTVTVTTTGNHNIPAGDWVLQIYGAPTDWLPTYSAGTPSLVNAHSNNPASNTFTYATDQVPRGGFSSQGWNYPLKYGHRIRKATECYIGADNWNTLPYFAVYDFDYGGEAQDNKNNVMIGLGKPAETFPWVMATHSSRPIGGWHFSQCTGSALTTFSPTSVSGPRAVFADLPRNPGVYQPGPYEGQEYDIVDGQKFGGGAASWGDQVQGGSNGQYKVRYGGSPLAWRRIG
jgi:Pectate lyase superfamily protein